jgi:hypothetical protein
MGAAVFSKTLSTATKKESILSNADMIVIYYI